MDYKNHLFITGFYRSGTSLLSQFLNMCGYATGGCLNSEINAGFEDEQVQKIVTTMQMNNLTEDLILFLEKEIKKVDLLVMKHPRLLFNPNLLKIWTNVKPNISLLITYREPLFSLKSKLASSGEKGFFTNYSSAQLDQKFHEFVSQVIHLRIRHKILYFPDFLEDYNAVYHSISSLGIHIDKDKGNRVWNNLIDFNKVHFK